MSGVLGRSEGGGRFLMGVVPRTLNPKPETQNTGSVSTPWCYFSFKVYKFTSLIRKRALLRPYRSPCLGS